MSKEKTQLELLAKTTTYTYPSHILDLFGEEGTTKLDELVLVLHSEPDTLKTLQDAIMLSDDTIEDLVDEFGIEAVNAACWLIKTNSLDDVITTG